jgi:hypothetical protein
MLQYLKYIYSAFGFIQAIKKGYDQWKAEKKAKEDAKKIEEAFKNGDANALNSVINGVSDEKEQPKL